VKTTCALRALWKFGKKEENATAQIIATADIVTSGWEKRFQNKDIWRFILTIRKKLCYACSRGTAYLSREQT
jgi:hypothetical protein